MGGMVGVMLGLAEGIFVGSLLGAALGRDVGLTVGLYVLVGPLLLGWLVGCGDTDGAEVGLLLGWRERTCEGCEDGVNVGFLDGREVDVPLAEDE